MDTSKRNTVDAQLIHFLVTRRSVPAKLMAGPGPDETQLRVILEIASRVPDHGKLAPWRFVHYGKKKCVDLGLKILDRASEIAKENDSALGDELVDIELNRFCRAPVVIAVVSCANAHPKIPEWEQVLSCGAVAMNMLIAANAHGFDAQWLTEWYAYDDALKQEFGLNNDERIAGFIHIGTRKNPKSDRTRPVLEDIYTKMET